LEHENNPSIFLHVEVENGNTYPLSGQAGCSHVCPNIQTTSELITGDGRTYLSIFFIVEVRPTPIMQPEIPIPKNFQVGKPVSHHTGNKSL
jgi:hypothetical protein